MTSDDFNQEFLPKEIVLRLIKDIPQHDYVQKLKLLNEYLETVKADFDPLFFEIKSNENKGFIYWEAGEYALAVHCYEQVVALLDPAIAAHLYLFAAQMLVRCHRQLKNYTTAYAWAEKILDNEQLSTSAFDKLLSLGEYAELLKETGNPFNEKYRALITGIVDELGFPSPPSEDPLHIIAELRSLNKKWNMQLSKIHLASLPPAEKIKALETYIRDCEIGWYKKHVQEKLDSLLN